MDELKQKIEQFFSEKVTQHGAHHSAVDFNSENSQHIRFAQQTKLFDPNERYSVIDLGCGYGAYAHYLHSVGHHFQYCGVDLSEKMILQAQEHCRDLPCTFTVGDTPDAAADYVVASGLFNVKMGSTTEAWEAFIRDTLHKMHHYSTKGFTCNFLTSYSDPERMRDDLYYADPCFWFDYCKKNFSRNVALLHDYTLFDFTLLVRK